MSTTITNSTIEETPMHEATLEVPTHLSQLQSQLMSALESLGQISEEQDGQPPTQSQVDKILSILNDIDYKLSKNSSVTSSDIFDKVGNNVMLLAGEIESITRENTAKVINSLDTINGTAHSQWDYTSGWHKKVTESLDLLNESSGNIASAIDDIELDTSTIEVDLNVNDYGLEVSLDSSDLESSINGIDEKLEDLSEKISKTSRIMKTICTGVFAHPDLSDDAIQDKLSEGELSIFGEALPISIYDMIRKMATWITLASQVQSRILDSVEAQQELIKLNTKEIQYNYKLLGAKADTQNDLLAQILEQIKSTSFHELGS